MLHHIPSSWSQSAAELPSTGLITSSHLEIRLQWLRGALTATISASRPTARFYQSLASQFCLTVQVVCLAQSPLGYSLYCDCCYGDVGLSKSEPRTIHCRDY